MADPKVSPLSLVRPNYSWVMDEAIGGMRDEPEAERVGWNPATDLSWPILQAFVYFVFDSCLQI